MRTELQEIRIEALLMQLVPLRRKHIFLVRNYQGSEDFDKNSLNQLGSCCKVGTSEFNLSKVFENKKEAISLFEIASFWYVIIK